MQASPMGMMGYDRAITIFSPDGRLLQVEYARKTISKGTTAIGIACNEGVIIIATKRVMEKLLVSESIKKITKIDDNIGVTMSGLISDGRVLIERAQNIVHSYKLTYDETIDLLSLVREISDYKQMFTQWGGARPFGVSLMLCGIDELGPHIFITEPSGIYFEYEAVSIGENSAVVNKHLEKYYKKDMPIEKGIMMGISALKKAVTKEEFDEEFLEVAVIPSKTKKFEKIDKEKIKKYIKQSE